MVLQSFWNTVFGERKRSRSSPWQLCRSAEPPRGFGTASLLIAAFIVLVLVTHTLTLDAHQASAFWPANGALVVAMLILPKHRCILVLLVCFGVDVAVNLCSNFSVYSSCIYAILNVAVSYSVALQTRWLCGATTDLTRIRRLCMFGIIAFFSTAIEAAMGEALEPSGTTFSAVANDWLQWTMCDGVGFLLATPAILLVVKSLNSKYSYEAGPAERWLLLAFTTFLTFLSFFYVHAPFLFLIYPLLILTAFRAGPPWVLASILNTAVISSGLTAHGYGPLAVNSASSIFLSQSMVQSFLISIFLAAVPANNALGERSRVSRRLVRMKAIVEHTATHDGLTTLVNRDLFRRRLSAMLQAATQCAVLFVDLDRFKNVNDTMGHGAGDELLRAFSVRIVEVAGPEATVARFGGDEFAILVPSSSDSVDPEDLCRRITEVARTPFLLARGPAHISASIGLALAKGWNVDAGELMRKADIALYAVKAMGRNGYQIFSEALDRSACDRAEIGADLRLAIEQPGQLELHYQPKVDKNSIVRGVEALLRWRHPTKGLVPATEVICVAEESGLIIPLGNWILHEALAFAARWPELDMCINVSPTQLNHPLFVEATLEAFGCSQVSPGHLELEVTETALMGDITVVNNALAALREAGIRIALDDFGTGYSSLRHLHRCAVDRVKIDQSFVSELEGSHEAAAIIRAVIQLGHAMDLQITAEGVETERQREFLISAGIDELQGYLFSRPVDERDFAAMMRTLQSDDSSIYQPPYAIIRGGLG
jgi:diguanylate cyclase (GGDEF)-like protein